jgi:hypothetical protein
LPTLAGPYLRTLARCIRTGSFTITDGKLLVLLALHLVLTGLPGVAVVLFAMRRGLTRVPLLVVLGLAGSGLVGLLGFWTAYAGVEIGQTFAFFAVFGSILLAGLSVWGGNLDRRILVRLAEPLALWMLGAAFLLFLGFLHGGTLEPLVTAQSRFSHPLPTDAEIPNFFIGWFAAHGHAGTVPVFPGEWMSSDRPPLQVGYGLYQHPFHNDQTGLDYEVLGVALQQLWIVGLWAVLDAAGLGRRTRALTMVAVLVSGLAIVNGFFVWPKMLSAAFLLAAAALVLTPLWSEVRRSLWGAALVAGLCGLALMGHGSSVFGVIPLVIVAAWRGLPHWRWIGVAILAGILVMAPWSAYQKWGDPPGNRLTKWTLAADPGGDDLSTGAAVRKAYSEAGLGGTITNKWENFEVMLGAVGAQERVENAIDGDNLATTVAELRELFFFFLLPSFSLLLLGPLAMLFGFRRRDRDGPEWGFALRCFAVLVVGAFFWGLIVFGTPVDGTALHIFSFAVPVLAMAGAIAGLRSVLPRFATGWVVLYAVLSLILYVPALAPLPGTSYSALAALLAALALAGFVAIAVGGSRLFELLPRLTRAGAAGGASS